MSDESQFVIFLPEMVQEQRNPDDQGCGSDDDGQGNQSQILFAENKQTRDGRITHVYSVRA